MKKTKLLPPYIEGTRKTTFNQRNKAGVYIIFKEGNVRYVGMSQTDVYKSLYRHFQDWNDKTQERVVYTYLKGIKCRVIYCTAAQALRLERALILTMKPTDNPNKFLQYTLDLKDKETIKQAQQAEEVPF